MNDMNCHVVTSSMNVASLPMSESLREKVQNKDKGGHQFEGVFRMLSGLYSMNAFSSRNELDEGEEPDKIEQLVDLKYTSSSGRAVFKQVEELTCDIVTKIVDDARRYHHNFHWNKGVINEDQPMSNPAIERSQVGDTISMDDFCYIMKITYAAGCAKFFSRDMKGYKNEKDFKDFKIFVPGFDPDQRDEGAVVSEEVVPRVLRLSDKEPNSYKLRLTYDSFAGMKGKKSKSGSVSDVIGNAPHFDWSRLEQVDPIEKTSGFWQVTAPFIVTFALVEEALKSGGESEDRKYRDNWGAYYVLDDFPEYVFIGGLRYYLKAFSVKRTSRKIDVVEWDFVTNSRNTIRRIASEGTSLVSKEPTLSEGEHKLDQVKRSVARFANKRLSNNEDLILIEREFKHPFLDLGEKRHHNEAPDLIFYEMCYSQRGRLSGSYWVGMHKRMRVVDEEQN